MENFKHKRTHITKLKRLKDEYNELYQNISPNEKKEFVNDDRRLSNHFRLIQVAQEIRKIEKAMTKHEKRINQEIEFENKRLERLKKLEEMEKRRNVQK